MLLALVGGGIHYERWNYIEIVAQTQEIWKGTEQSAGAPSPLLPHQAGTTTLAPPWYQANDFLAPGQCCCGQSTHLTKFAASQLSLAALGGSEPL